MDTLLDGILKSPHPEAVKRHLIEKIFLIHYNANDCRNVLEVATRFIAADEKPFIQEICLRVFEYWSVNNIQCLEEFITDNFLTTLLLSDAYINRSPINHLVYRILETLKDTERGLGLFHVISNHVVLLASRVHSLKELKELALILLTWPMCIPKVVESKMSLASIILKMTACVEVPPAKASPILFEINVISQLFKFLLRNMEKHDIMAVLRDVYSILSNPDVEPSWALASIVQFLPMTVSPEVVSHVMTDTSIENDVLYVALKRMMNWLMWSSDPNSIANWIMTLLRGLALANKYPVLTRLAEESVEQIFDCLSIPDAKMAALLVLSHLLLSYQHTPNVFHKIVKRIPLKIVQWQSEQQFGTTDDTLDKFVMLVHIMIYKHNGFPDLYDPVLAVLDSFPKPSVDLMNEMLLEHKWSSTHTAYSLTQSNCTPRSDTGKTGLLNMGNTCYMNSIIQTLYMTDEFRNAILQANPYEHQSILIHLQRLFAFLTHTQRSVLNATDFYKASRPPWFESGSQQDCSEYLRHLLVALHEQEKTPPPNQIPPICIPTLVPCREARLPTNLIVHTSVRGRAPSPSPSLNSSSSLSPNGTPQRKQKVARRRAMPRPNSCIPDIATDCGEPMICCPIIPNPPPPPPPLPSIKSLVHQAFAGRLVTSYKCLSCHKVSESAESFIDLHLAFPSNARHNRTTRYQIRQASKQPSSSNNHVSSDVEMTNADAPATVASTPPPNNNTLCLEDLIDYYMCPELLEKENKYFCSNCNKLSDGERSIRIVETPQYLILTLLRFSFDSGTRSRSKILTDVIYPLSLYLPVRHTEEGETATRKEEAQRNRFILYSVVIHSGVSSESGHYYTCARHPNKIDVTVGMEDENVDAPTWLMFNDSHVSYCSFKSFGTVTKRFPKDTAYVLFYRKCTNTPAQNTPAQTTLAQGQVQDPALLTLPKELKEMIERDNIAFVQDKEMDAKLSRCHGLIKPYPWKSDKDDNNPPGNCGGGFGGMHYNRFVY